MWKSFLEPNPENLVQFLKGKPRMCEGLTRTPGASHSRASLPQAPVIHHSSYLSVLASLWHLVSSAPYKQVCIPTPTAMQFFPGWTCTCRFQGIRMTYDLSSLTSLRKITGFQFVRVSPIVRTRVMNSKLFIYWRWKWKSHLFLSVRISASF